MKIISWELPRPYMMKAITRFYLIIFLLLLPSIGCRCLALFSFLGRFSPNMSMFLLSTFRILFATPWVMTSGTTQLASHLDPNIPQFSWLKDSFHSLIPSPLCLWSPRHVNISRWKWFRHIRYRPVCRSFNWFKDMIISLHILWNFVILCNVVGTTGTVQVVLVGNWRAGRGGSSPRRWSRRRGCPRGEASRWTRGSEQ
jgi:hypothetical protein